MSWDRDLNHYRGIQPIDDLWEFLPRNQFLTWGVPRCVVCVPQNVAIEFDAKWCEQTEKYIRSFEGVLMMEKVDTVWFVDYRLQRDTQSMSEEMSQYLQANREVFYAQDRRFVEVDSWDSEWRVWDEAGKESVSGGVFEFVNKLEDLQWASYLTEDDDGNLVPMPVLKVLGCELL